MKQALKEQYRLFGQYVLRVLEREKEWTSDTVDEISDAAMDLGLAHTDNEGNFKVWNPVDSE